MTLLKIDRVVINLDRVACVRDLSDRDATGQVTRGLYRVEFDNGHHVEISGAITLDEVERIVIRS
jgi:hypothetical protein